MTDPIIPVAAKLAAKRGFVRTTAQSYAATLTAGLPSAAAILTLIHDQDGWLLAGVTVALAVVSPPVAGLASYLSILNRGIPEAYIDATLTTLSTLDKDEQEADINGAVSRTLRRDLRDE